MKISIITPTEERPEFLKGLYSLLKRQTFTNWEWLIYDTSLKPLTFSDEKVRSIQDTSILSVGEKRNRLVEASKGDVIVHCDDDDYYAPHYLETVSRALQSHDFFNIHSWFSYHLPTKQYYYWDTNEESQTRFFVDPMTEMQVREIDFGPHFGSKEEHVNIKGKKGYGFSFSYSKKMWLNSPFPHLDISEDRVFYEAVEEKGGKILSVADQKGIVVHIIHTQNLSRLYPQYRIPSFMAAPLFPDFLRYLDSLNEN